MAAIDYSIGFTQQEVEEILTVQKAELKKAMASFSESGSSVTKRSISDIHEIINACQAALQTMDPATYGTSGTRRVSRSKFIGTLER